MFLKTISEPLRRVESATFLFLPETRKSPGHKDTFFHFTWSSILHLLGKLLKDFIKTIWSVAIHVSKSMPKDGAHDCSIAVIPPVNGVDLWQIVKIN